MDELFLERLTWPEVEAAMKRGARTAVIVAASSEQHGPHLPEATDALLGEALAERLARKLGDALVAPVIRPGCSDHHMGFPGTITISPELLMALLDSYVDCLRRHGFSQFVVTSSHGGNFPVLDQWKGRHADAIVLSDFAAFVEAMFAALRRHGRQDTTIPHADVMETASMLAARPELVRLERAEPGFEGETELADLQARGMRAITPNGVLGNPVGATAEMGETILEELSSFLAEQARVQRAETAG